MDVVHGYCGVVRCEPVDCACNATEIAGNRRDVDQHAEREETVELKDDEPIAETIEEARVGLAMSMTMTLSLASDTIVMGYENTQKAQDKTPEEALVSAQSSVSAEMTENDRGLLYDMIAKASSAKKAVRLRVTGIMSSAAVLLLLITLAVFMVAARGGSGVDVALYAASTCTFVLAGLTFMLAPQPDAVCLTYGVTLFFAFYDAIRSLTLANSARRNIINALNDDCDLDLGSTIFRVSRAFCTWTAVVTSIIAVVATVSAIACIWAACSRSSARRLARMWSITKWTSGTMSLYAIAQCLNVARSDNPTIRSYAFFFVALAITYAFSTFVAARPGVQGKVHSFLANLGDKSGSRAAAASIACLLGGKGDVNFMVREASERFRGIRLSQLSPTDVESNQPMPAMFQRSISLPLGDCDAFISHSWRDTNKFAALTQVSKALSYRGKEPTFWFDKCCIDQGNIERDLRCLPTFLWGCKRLVVLLGPSYSFRLWCVMELFTFIQIGRTINDIDVMYVCTEEEEEVVSKYLKSFDAREAECFDPKDKENMLRIIDSSCGMDAFNRIVRQLLVAAVEKASHRVSMRVEGP